MRQAGASTEAPKTATQTMEDKEKEAGTARSVSHRPHPPDKGSDVNRAGTLTPNMERNRVPGGVAGGESDSHPLPGTKEADAKKKTVSPDRDVTYPIIEENPPAVTPSGTNDTAVIIHADGSIDRK